MVQPLMNVGYNVVVEMNGKNEKNYSVSYLSNGKIKKWKIPTKELHQLANDGSLSKLSLFEGKFDTGIVRAENCSLPDILQASLFMGTEYQDRIRQNVSKETYMKLFKMNSVITDDLKTNKRPEGYPERPCVALVVGNLASRGITIQDPCIDFVCTSFVFTDLNDTLQRGAQSTQKFGRACGNLFCKYTDERTPVVIATRKIVEAALANYNAVNENSKNIKNGAYINLRYYITGQDWKGYRSEAKDTIRTLIKKRKIFVTSRGDDVVDGVDIARIKQLVVNKTYVGKILEYLRQNDGAKTTVEELYTKVEYDNDMDAFLSTICNGRGIRCKYGKLWNYSNGSISINTNIIKYFNM
jgi:hypothetical protein